MVVCNQTSDLPVLEILIANGFVPPNLRAELEEKLRSENSFYQLFQGKFIPRLPPEQRESLEAALETSDPAIQAQSLPEASNAQVNPR